ncbi:MAG: hypothetical protein MMC33_008131 [Icmadophila ericetorum]|nr:hypothetical protein [Icmadophila ericetorum]
MTRQSEQSNSGKKRAAEEVPKVTKRAKTTKGNGHEQDFESIKTATPKKRVRQTETTVAKAEVNGEEVAVAIAQTEEVELSVTTPKGKKRAKKVVKKEEEEEIEFPKKSRKAKKEEAAVEVEGSDAEGKPVKVKRKRKTKEEKEAEAMPLAARTLGLRMFVGAHVSCAKGVHNSVTNAVHIGGNAFALFLKSQRKWENPPLQDEQRDQFKAFCNDHKFDASKHILPHGSYLVNLAQEDPEKAKQAYDAFLDDLYRCEALGIKLYNFHPGNTGSATRSSAISRIANALNRAHAATKTVKPVLENMAGGGNVIGSTFEDLRDIISQIEDKSRIGVCIDTCHSFVAGYDLRSPETFKATLQQFDDVVGMKYLSALHLNDSKAPFNSHRDLHQNIGTGFLGLRAFHNIMNEPRFEGLPMALETPIDRKGEDGKVVEDKGVWAGEIKLLESLIGIDAEGEEFKMLEADLQAKGAEERVKYQDAFDRKQDKEKKAAEKGVGKSRKKEKKEESSDEEGDSDGR